MGRGAYDNEAVAVLHLQEDTGIVLLTRVSGVLLHGCAYPK